MAVSLPNGATISIASAYGSNITVSAITNANPGVATATAHGLSDGDILEVTSGWSQLNGRIARVDASDTNTFALENINTTSTTKYPAGSGTGTVREVTAWTQITQILETESDGGEQQFTTYRFLEDSKERRIPTFKTAEGLTFNVADDDGLPHYAILLAAEEDDLPRAIRVQLPSGDVLYYNAYVSFNPTPTLTIDEVMALEVTLSFVAESIRYGA